MSNQPSSRPQPRQFMDIIPRTVSRPRPTKTTPPARPQATRRQSVTTTKSAQPLKPKPSAQPSAVPAKTFYPPSKTSQSQTKTKPQSKPQPKPSPKPAPKPTPPKPAPQLKPVNKPTPFINTEDLPKRPLSPAQLKPSKNLYTKPKTKPTPKDIPAMVTTSPSRGSGVSLFFAILVTTLLGAVVGAITYFAFFQK